jgi:hypothetical protein
MAIVNFEENFNYKYVYSKEVIQKYDTKMVTYSSITADDIYDLTTHHKDTDNVCGTNACIVGFTLAIQTPEVIQSIRDNLDEFEFATEWLELTREESTWLFEPEGITYKEWDEEECRFISEKYVDYLAKYKYDESFIDYRVCTKEQGYNEALRRIDYLIEHYSNANCN